MESSGAFKKFRSEFPDAYLAHVFSHVKREPVDPEIGYYSSGKDLIAVFTASPVAMRPPEEAFKESGAIERLEIGEVKVGLVDLRSRVDAYRKERYPAHPVQQEIIILQQLGRPVWNVTLVTETLSMLNIRVCAVSGEILQEEMRNILDLRK